MPGPVLADQNWSGRTTFYPRTKFFVTAPTSEILGGGGGGGGAELPPVKYWGGGGGGGLQPLQLPPSYATAVV